jgi:hypothetical protein
MQISPERNTTVTPKIYLDTNIFSRISDQRLPEVEAKAYDDLGKLANVKLVTSAKTKHEIDNTPSASRAALLNFVLSQFEKVTWEVAEYGGAIGAAPFGATPIGGSWSDPKYDALKKTFDADDAMHIFQAVQSACTHFVTLDEKTILARAKNHHESVTQICGSLFFGKPSEVVAHIESIQLS